MHVTLAHMLALDAERRASHGAVTPRPHRYLQARQIFLFVEHAVEHFVNKAAGTWEREELIRQRGIDCRTEMRTPSIQGGRGILHEEAALGC